MFSRPGRSIAIFAAFSFAVLAFVFVLLGITSNKWAQRDHYDSSVPEDWKHPNYTSYRSPFRICTATPTFKEYTDDQDVKHSILVSYAPSCNHYRPYGWGRTSCELPTTLNTTTNSSDTTALRNRGDARLCQQVHLAGDFAISGTVFISLGALLAIFMVILAAFQMMSSTKSPKAPVVDPSSCETRPKTVTDYPAQHPSEEPTQSGRTGPLKSAVSVVNLLTIVFLLIGAVLVLISQFYAVMGFIQSSPNNSDFASSAFGTGQAEDSNANGFHGPWYQGMGLSVYMTCAWAFAAATATMAARTWDIPDWTILE
ncbi:hypothetical protein LTR84_008402 [Exophiala bonariae]|uniref:Uncharacterized protein n=1 Tax=Exophiala bonariae TaxID=1690606 RepID=A0AAV9MY90_9EURO|nr:hypothetical protein LTR84_008402 [Exophiala bonariae]